MWVYHSVTTVALVHGRRAAFVQTLKHAHLRRKIGIASDTIICSSAPLKPDARAGKRAEQGIKIPVMGSMEDDASSNGLHVVCPVNSPHQSEEQETSTALYQRSAGGNSDGGKR